MMIDAEPAAPERDDGRFRGTNDRMIAMLRHSLLESENHATPPRALRVMQG
jgi:hypothetical protein